MQNFTNSSALALLIPEEYHTKINDIRIKHDKAYPRWMPHVNLIYPFVENSSIQTVYEILKSKLNNFQKFEVNLNQIGQFNQGKKATIHLKPNDDDTKIIELQNLIVKEMPQIKTSQREFKPHLTLGQCDISKVDEFINDLKLNGIDQIIKQELKDISIITRDEIDKTVNFSINKTIELNPNNSINRSIELNPNNQTENTEINITNKLYKTIIACDNTGSMGQSAKAMASSMAQVDAIFELTTGQKVVKAVVGDYDSSTPDNHQGGVAVLEESAGPEEISEFMNKQVKAIGGGGTPEAYKTLLNILLRDTQADSESIMCLFLDAQPHGVKKESLDSEGLKEKEFIEKNGMIWDWDILCQAFKTAGQHVVILLTSPDKEKIEIWSKLGYVISVNNNNSSFLTKTLLSVLYALIGQPQNDSLSQSQRNPVSNKIEEISRIDPVQQSDLSQTLRNTDPVKVIGVFDYLLDKSKPSNALALTTSPILGKAWRLICGSYKYMLDRKYEAECQRVIDKLSACNLLLDNADRSVMKEWIDLSHDETPQIRSETAKAIENSETFLVLPRELRGTVSIDDVLDLGRGGGKYKVLGQLITSLQADGAPASEHKLPEDEMTAPDFLPLEGLKTHNVFSMIGNLLSPGLRFSKTVSLMAAILALPNKHLGGIASKYLSEHIGKWINWEIKEDGTQSYPVFWAINFFRLLKLCPNEQLTDGEIQFRDKYLQLNKIVINHNSEVGIKVPAIIPKIRNDVTWKRLCDPNKGGCGQHRCFSIFPGCSDICGICIAVQDPAEVQALISRQVEQDPRKIVEGNEHSNWVQCKTCCANYGVTTVENFNVRAKCHDCRRKLEPEQAVCRLCLHKYCSPGGSAVKAMLDALNDYESKARSELKKEGMNEQGAKAATIKTARDLGEFVCPRCVEHPHDMIVEIPVRINELITQNSPITNLIPVSNYETLMKNNVKFWKRVMEVEVLAEKAKSILNDDNINNSTFERMINITYQGFTVHKSNEAINSILNKLLSHSGVGQCQLCASDVSVRSMKPACGHCRNSVCNGCFDSWYSQVQVGRVVAHGHTLCPFCKSTPKHALVKKMALGYLRNIRVTKRNKHEVCVWDPRWVQACCRLCIKVLPALQRDCADEALEINNFVCEMCENAQNELIQNGSDHKESYKQCPKCNAPTHKAGGCNHITCTNVVANEEGEPAGRCDAHWCWSCGKDRDDDSGAAFDSHTIQDHLAKCGGIFPGDIGEDDEQYDEDYQDD